MRIKGLKYSLEDEPLAFVTQGLSNELSQTEACVCVSEGIARKGNMSGFVCPKCGEKIDIFKSGGGEETENH